MENVLCCCVKLFRYKKCPSSAVSFTLSSTILTLKHKVDILNTFVITSDISLSNHFFYRAFDTAELASRPFSSSYTRCNTPSSTYSHSASPKSLLSNMTTKSLYFFSPTYCKLICGPYALPYGYEYRGSSVKVVLTPPAERCLVSLLLCCGEDMGVVLNGRQDGVGIGTETAMDLSQVHYIYNTCYA